MIVKEFLINIGKVVVKSAKHVVQMICAAKVENIAKAALFVGVSSYTAYILIKSLKERRESYQNEDNMSIVDRTLTLNYKDRDKYKTLRPLLDDVKKEIEMTKKRAKKSKKFKNKLRERKNEVERMKLRTQMARDGFIMDAYNDERMRKSLLREIDEFEQDMEVIEHLDRLRDAGEGDQQVLRRIWKCPAY